MRVSLLEHDKVYRKFAWEMRKERVAIKKDDHNTTYYAYMVHDNPVGVVGWQWISDKHCRFKAAFITKAFRGQGIYSVLWKSRFLAILQNERVETISAFCTDKSLPKFLKEGFKPVSEKNGITYVTYKVF